MFYNGVMSKRGKKRLHLVFTVAALLLLAVLLLANRHQLGETWLVLQSLDWQLLLILPTLQLVSHFFIALTYKSVIGLYGSKIPLSRTLPMVWALNFVNQILPSGGLSGLTYLIYGMRNFVSGSKAALAHLTRYLLSYFSYALILAGALGLLLLGHDLSQRAIWIVAWLSLISVAFLGGAIFLAVRQKIVHGIITKIAGFGQRLSERFAKHQTKVGERIASSLTEFYHDFLKIAKQRSHLGWPLIFMVLSTIFENLIVIASFVITGADINPGLIMISFAVANGVGIISVVPGDVGVHEATMIAALTAGGVSFPVATSGVLLYRVFNKMIFLPLGFVSYTKLLKPARP